ncbi:MAG: hypothetical protein JSR33_12655 [Proteobacteria bacterium]|nr:hypothetical protein [Pseudomonadota bacterium]
MSKAQSIFKLEVRDRPSVSASTNSSSHVISSKWLKLLLFCGMSRGVNASHDSGLSDGVIGAIAVGAFFSACCVVSCVYRGVGWCQQRRANGTQYHAAPDDENPIEGGIKDAATLTKLCCLPH